MTSSNPQKKRSSKAVPYARTKKIIAPVRDPLTTVQATAGKKRKNTSDHEA